MASIAELILEQGRQQAERIRRSGERRGQIVTSLAQLPTQIAANNRAEQELAIRQRREATQEQVAQQQLDQGALTIQRIKDDAERKRQLEDVFNSPETHDPETDTVNIPKALAIAQQKGYKGLANDIVTIGQDHNAKTWQIAAAKATATAKEGPQLMAVNPGDVVIDKSKPSAGAVFTAPPKPEKVTFSAPQPVMVGGKRTLVRAGSDDKLYDMKGQVVTADVAPDVPPPPPITPYQQQELDLRRKELEAKGAGIDVSPNVRTTSRGRQYLDLSLFPGAETGKAREAANKAGVVPVSKETADALKEVENARMNQQSILDQITPLLPKDPTGRITGAATRKLSEVLQTNDQRAAFNSWRTAAINSLRATAGSKGLRINQAEIEQAVNNDIPTLNDTISVAIQKNQNINTMLDNVETSNLGKVKVRDPNGKIHEFDTPAQAAEFRRLAGL